MQECCRTREACEASQEQLGQEKENSAKMEDKVQCLSDICHRVRTQDCLHFVD